MSAPLNFDARSVAPDTGSQDAIPAGWYDAAIDQSEMKPTKDGTGAYLECRCKILNGPHSGKYVYARLNLRNANAQAQEIGYKQLSAICHAVGVLQVADSAQLHDKPMKIKVKLRQARQERDGQGNVVAEYEASNEISAYKNINEQVGTPAAAGFATPSAPTPPASFQVPPAAGAPQQFQPPVQQQPQMQQQYQQQQQPPAQQWTPPVAQQPWQQPQQQQVAQEMQQPPQFQAPVQQQPVQQFQPPVQQQPAQQQQQPAQQQQQVAPAWANAQTQTPPWMQGQPGAAT